MSAQRESTIRDTEGERRAPSNKPVIYWFDERGVEQVLELGKAPIEIGRGDECTLRVDDKRASWRHARVSLCSSSYVLQDLDSKNGTYVAGARIGDAPLYDGSVFRVGATVGIFAEVPLGQQTAMREVAPRLWGGPKLSAGLSQARAIARAGLPVLIYGETGTGKEAVAEALHGWSNRKGKLVPLNCGALARGIEASQLFGHKAGAFTGANRDAPGYFRAAHKGSLFLDEIAELPPDAQTLLLRALQDRQGRHVAPVGETKTVPNDVFVIAATHQRLDQAEQQGRFRADLLARLSGFTLTLCPLRERREEVPSLAAKFLRDGLGRTPKMSGRFMEELCNFDWPKNVRQLEMCMHRIGALHGSEERLEVRHLPEEIFRSGPPIGPGIPPDPGGTLVTRERMHRLLVVHQGVMSAVARELGVSRQRIYRDCDALGLDYEAFRKA